MNESATSPRKRLAVVRHYLVLAYGALGTMLDVGLMVLGSLLIGLALSVLAAGFGIVDIAGDLSTGAMLVSALILSVTGLFCLGLASEGPLGRGRRLAGFELWEIGVGRALAAAIVGLAALALHGLLVGLVDGLPLPLRKGAETFRAVGASGTTLMPLVGVPFSIFIRWLPVKYEWIRRADVPILYLIWAIAAFSDLS